MTKFKGTKGKWVYLPFNKESNGYINIEIPRGQITVYNGHYPFNMLENKDKCIEISEANAKLIACAPEMLEMLEVSVNLLRQTTEFEVLEIFRKSVSDIELLIKKATE